MNCSRCNHSWDDHDEDDRGPHCTISVNELPSCRVMELHDRVFAAFEIPPNVIRSNLYWGI